MSRAFSETRQSMQNYAGLGERSSARGASGLASGISQAGGALGNAMSEFPRRQQEAQLNEVKMREAYLGLAKDEMDLRVYQERVNALKEEMSLRQLMAQTQMMEVGAQTELRRLKMSAEKVQTEASLGQVVWQEGNDHYGIDFKDGSPRKSRLGDDDFRVKNFIRRQQNELAQGEAKARRDEMQAQKHEADALSSMLNASANLTRANDPSDAYSKFMLQMIDMGYSPGEPEYDNGLELLKQSYGDSGNKGVASVIGKIKDNPALAPMMERAIQAHSERHPGDDTLELLSEALVEARAANPGIDDQALIGSLLQRIINDELLEPGS